MVRDHSTGMFFGLLLVPGWNTPAIVQPRPRCSTYIPHTRCSAPTRRLNNVFLGIFFFSSTHFVFSFGRKSGVYSCLYKLTEPNHTFARSGEITYNPASPLTLVLALSCCCPILCWLSSSECKQSCASALGSAFFRFLDFATCDLFRWCVLSLLRLTPPLLSTEIWPNAWRVPCFQMNIPGFSLPWGGFLGSCWQATAGCGGSTTTEMFTSSLKADS